MKYVCEKDLCTACRACVEKCPVNAIKIEDKLKSYNAVIDEKTCIECNACRRVCQNKSEIEKKEPISWYQGWANDNKIRLNSTSGGFATAILKGFIQENGVVCSCIYDKGDFCFRLTDNIEDVDKYSGSKYVKSNPQMIYKKIQKLLTNKIKVLFLGLPCQVEAVKKYVGKKDFENLYTVDLICHGTPSLQMLNIFMQKCGLDINDLSEIRFRTKMDLDNYKSIEINGIEDAYTFAFLKGLTFSECCYSCQFAGIARPSDLTIGDSWGSTLPETEKNKGLSLALCQTIKGERLLQMADLYLTDVDSTQAINSNSQLKNAMKKKPEREVFVRYLEKGKSFQDAMFLVFPQTVIKQKMKKLLIKSRFLRGMNSQYRILYKTKK
ncbi:Coenzyme F420 hydrogenase/dehydrogenase, beta subunit C-terminal domain [Eubacterium ramulus]